MYVGISRCIDLFFNESRYDAFKITVPLPIPSEFITNCLGNTRLERKVAYYCLNLAIFEFFYNSHNNGNCREVNENYLVTKVSIYVLSHGNYLISYNP